jgi:hypothetical protein
MNIINVLLAFLSFLLSFTKKVLDEDYSDLNKIKSAIVNLNEITMSCFSFISFFVASFRILIQDIYENNVSNFFHYHLNKNHPKIYFLFKNNYSN